MRRYSSFVAAAACILTGTSAAHAQTAPVNVKATPQTIGMRGAVPNFEKVEIESPHVYDYTFTEAPTDWRVQSGIWEMTNRWACAPGWSWFGGRSDEVASVWNKRKFSGDISVQFYFAFKMGLSGAKDLWEVPSDAAITIGGDGQNLASGYSFIIGADGNSRSVLRRGSQIVAQSSAPEAVLPPWADGKPADFDEIMHRRWWYARIDKIGNRVSCYVDNKLLFSYDDPKPLDAGQIALWTYNNGIMLSRVQVYYENEVRNTYAKRSSSAALRAASTPSAPVKTKVSAMKKLPENYARRSE
jgi:hypothetical protein